MEEESSSYSLELECLPPEPSSEFQTARQGGQILEDRQTKFVFLDQRRVKPHNP
jgi:hypothetical protein